MYFCYPSSSFLGALTHKPLAFQGRPWETEGFTCMTFQMLPYQRFG